MMLSQFPECCVRITADVSWMDGPVWTQPQPRVLSSETDEWSSGICDCCDVTKECISQQFQSQTKGGKCLKLLVLSTDTSLEAINSHHVCVCVCVCVFEGCFAFWCGPCFACKISRTLGQCLCLPLLDAFGCIRPITLSMRVFVRQQYDIKGTLCNDCLCSTFCPQCVWCQMSREMKKRKLPTMLSDIVQR
uniref:Plac8 onzin related protein 2 n=1 Tax=Takifugu rubripes TaxID=31033 RepID=A0A674NSW5_TAKRU